MKTKYSVLVALFLSLRVITMSAERKPATAESRKNTSAVVIEPSTDGAIRLLAQNAKTHGATLRYEPQPHKNTLGYWTNVHDWASWEFRIRKAGTFDVELTQSCGASSAGSQYTVVIGDTTLRDTVPNTGTFTNFVRRIIGQVTLAKPQEYTLAVKPLTKPGLAVMDLRAITLAPRPAKSR